MKKIAGSYPPVHTFCCQGKALGCKIVIMSIIREYALIPKWLNTPISDGCCAWVCSMIIWLREKSI